MAKIKNPMRFSAAYGLDPMHLRSLGAFDPVLNADTPLFVDPLLLKQSNQPEMHAADAAWHQRFTDILMLLAASQSPTDAPGRAALKQFTFREFAGNCLGYGNGISGSGMGPALRQRVLATAKEIVDLGIAKPELFLLIPLLEEDVGPDRISDMTTRVIAKELERFTHRVLDGTDVPLIKFDIDGSTYELPVNKAWKSASPLPVVLVPSDVLKDLPIASSWADVARIAAENSQYRKRINDSIGNNWMKSSPRKNVLRSDVLATREAFEGLLTTVLKASRKPYDSMTDAAGWASWLEAGRKLAIENPLTLTGDATSNPAARLATTAAQIIGKFREVIENNGGWKLLWVNEKPRHESFAQLLFFAVADSYCQANSLDISPESNAGGGPVDFKFSQGYEARFLVEIKLSTNNLSSGYSKQLEAYKKGEKTHDAILLVIDVGGNDERINRVLELEIEAKNEGRKHSRIEVVDAGRKPSASKL